MTPPRRVLAGQTTFITWRAVGRGFRFVPVEKVNRILWYCLAYACKQYDVRVHEVVIMSNHGHLLATFGKANMPKFMELFNSLTARSLNALRGTSGTVIEKRYNDVVPQNAAKVVEHAAYTLANPCTASLVGRARHWKGVTTARMRYGQTIMVKKPKLGLWQGGTTQDRKAATGRKMPDARRPRKVRRSALPDVVEFRLERPPILLEMGDDELRDEVLAQVQRREGDAEEARRRKGRRVMGMRMVRKQHWAAVPRAEELFGMVPQVSGQSRWSRVAGIERVREFEAQYADARMRWMAGEREVEFPAGTWLMRERFGVRRAEGVVAVSLE